jgi:hypothetical protein
MSGMIGSTCEPELVEEDFQLDLSSIGSTRETAAVRHVLVDVLELLEDYSPSWYSARLRGRLLAALRAVDGQA